MKIIIFGATGKLGQHVLTLAKEAGHEVTAFVRSPDKIKMTNIHIILGDAYNAQDVANAITGHDAIISCLGSDSGIKKSQNLQIMGKNIADGMVKTGVNRIVSGSSGGVDGELTGILGKISMKILAHELVDHRAAMNYYKSKGFVYTFTRPMLMTNGSLRTDYLESFDGMPKGAFTISRTSVAHFMVKALTTKKYENASVGICNP